MSVRHALLALLSEGPKYGLQLREEFEARTGEVWPLNVGQVYTTLQRLERDGLVESDDAGDDGPQKGFRITADGEAELAGWLRTPPDLASPPRDELVIKVLVAVRVPGIDVHEVIQAHRRYLVRADAAVDADQGGRGRVRPGPRAGGRRRAVPAGFGHPVAGRRRRPPQARRRRTSPAGSGGAAEAAAQGGGAVMSGRGPVTGRRGPVVSAEAWNGVRR